MPKSQNTITFSLLFILTLSAVLSTGCKMGNFPKLPDTVWKKDNFKLSRSSKETIAPPSSTFDPKPSHFATMDDGRNDAMDMMASDQTQRPIRKPYDVDDTATGNSSNFGFPENAKSLMGNQNSDTAKDSQFSIPEASEFRQAMNNTAENTNEFAARTQQAASESFNSAKQFVANSAKSSGDFAAKSNDFIANRGNDVLDKSAEFARNLETPKTGDPKWKMDFDLPKTEKATPEIAAKPEPLANRLIGNDFQASVKKATEDAKKSMTDFNQKAFNQAGQGFRAAQNSTTNFAKQSVSQTNDQLTQAAGQFEKSWQNSAEQAKQTTEAIRNSTPVANSFQPSTSASNTGTFQPRQTQPVQPVATTQPQAQPRINRAIEVQPQVEFDRPKELVQPASNTTTGANSQFASTQSPAFQAQPKPSAPARSTSNNFQPMTTQSDSGYPSTNYATYENRGPDRISRVTPITQPKTLQTAPAQIEPTNSTPMLRARTKPASTSQPAPRTASLPSALLNGNSSYAPGSVKQLSTFK
jgi:hypothetical protein